MDDESYAVIEEILRGDEERHKINFAPNFKSNDHEWHTVSYRHQSKHSKKSQNFDNSNSGDVFNNLDNFSMKSDSADADEEGKIDAPKVKKAKMPKMTICDVATKIDAFDLAAFLFNIKVPYKKQEDILLMRFMGYFERAFGSISASQFPWVKILKESTVEKMIYIPISHISEDVYKTSIEWFMERSSEALGTFVLWLWDSILANLEIHQGSAKGPKKAVSQWSSKSQVAIFVVLAMTLRGKPEVLACLMPILRNISKYQGQDKLPVPVWVISQACQGDLAVGLFMWVNLLLPCSALSQAAIHSPET